MADYNQLALERAEKIGVYSYTVNLKKHTLEYISYFGREGFYKVVHNLDTHTETRTHQNSTSKKYNYFVG